jgi:hypothetical protein
MIIMVLKDLQTRIYDIVIVISVTLLENDHGEQTTLSGGVIILLVYYNITIEMIHHHCCRGDFRNNPTSHRLLLGLSQLTMVLIMIK